MRKASLALALLLALAFPAVALAEDQGDDDNNWGPNNSQHQDDDYQGPGLFGSKDEDFKHRHFDDKYDDISRVAIPPLAIRPGIPQDPHSYPLPSINPDFLLDPAEAGFLDNISDSLTGVTDNSFRTTQISNGSMVKLQVAPSTSKPVQIKNIVITDKTPRDEFMQNAVILGVVLGAVAFGLLALTSAQSINFRRKIK